MPKTKILFFSHSSYRFGAENCLLALVRGLDRERFESSVVLPAEGPLKLALDDLGVRSHIVPLEWWVKNEGRLLHSQGEIPLALDKLLRIIDEERPDIVHSNTAVVCWGAIAAALAGVRHVWHIHEILNGHPSLEPIAPLPLFYQAMDFLSDRLVAVSNDVKEEIVGFVNAGKLRVINNGVQHRAASPSPFREELNATSGQVVATTVTSLQKYKGIDNLLAAAARVVEQDNGIIFAIAGTGPAEAVALLKTSIKEMNLEGRVHYLGFRSDVAEILSGSDIFVLPSAREAFPLVVLEAMSHGKPVVATDCGGTTEMIGQEAGFVVPSENPDALAGKILDLARDDEKRRSMGNTARQRYTESFTIEHYLASFGHLYEELAAEEKPRLTFRQASLLNCFVTAYVDYLKAMRVIPELRQDLSRKKQELFEATQQHAEKVLLLGTHMENNTQQLIRQRTEELAFRDAIIHQLKDDLARTGEHILELEARLEEKNVELAALDLRLCQLAEEITCATQQKEVELSDRDERIRQITEGVAREAKLVEESIAAKNVTIRHQEEQIQAGVQSLVEIKRELRTLQSTHQEEVRRLQQRLSATEQQINDLLSSLSWKITGPLRKLYDLAKGK